MTALRVRRPAALAGLGERHAVVEASAGTGKTFVLEHLVVDLLLRRDLALEQILVVTFTEKATAELIQRVRGKLHELATLTDGHPLARDGAAAAPDDCWILDEAAKLRLRAALLSFDRASITTIHGFCQRLLVEHAFLQRRLFDEELVDEDDAFHDAFVETIRRDVAPDPALAPYLSAWLGSGRGLDRLETKVLLPCHRRWGTATVRPARLDEAALSAALRAFPAVDPAGGRLVEELKRRAVHANSAKALVPKAAALAQIGAAHGRGLPLADCLAAIEAAAPNDDDLLPWMCERLESVPDDGSPAGRLGVAVRALGRHVVPLAAELAHRILPSLARRLEARKRVTGLYDFQDMLALVARTLEDDDDRARSLIATLRGRYRHALIDEMQDTDDVQWSIFRRVFLDSPRGHVLTVIGDPKQAIYSFRGADVHTYLRACDEIRAAGGGATAHLVANFQSTAPLIDAYNAILDQTAPEPFFRRAGSIRYEHPVVCGRPELAFAGAAAPVVVMDVNTDQSMLYTWQVKQALLTAMVAELRKLLGDDGLFLGDKRLGAGDVYVLTRTTRESREVGDALRAAGIPFAFFKQERLFATVEAREVLDLLRAILDPDDATARARAYVTAFFGLSLPDLAACEDLSPGHPLVLLLYRWKALADRSAFEELFAAVVSDSGIVNRELFLRTGERRLTNYLHLLELLQEEAARTHATLRELVQTLAAYVSGARPPAHGGDVQRLETDAAAVQIMTIHHAKGLEAPVVFLYGAFWPGPRPEVRAFHEGDGAVVVRVGRPTADENQRIADEQLDEERRVLYVALTRARGRLYLPRYPPAFKNLRGSYQVINDRLRDLLGGLSPEPVKRLFDVVPVPCPLPPVVQAPPAAAALAAWRPPGELLAPEPDDGELRALAEKRAGFVITSYSALRRRREAAPIEAADDPAAGEEAAPDAVVLPPDELPRGRLSGAFLHECLEEVSLDGLRERPPLDDWQARPDVAELFERLRRRHDRRPAHLGHAQRLVHTALTAPVRLGDTIMPGLCTADRTVREMEFLYPIPERGHGAPAPDPRWRIERGAVKGFVDLLFEHAGRIYVCDWKGDWLPAWDASAVRAHAEAHYAIQARLYTLAALRLVGIAGPDDHDRRFGGVLYCFLRGMRADDADAGIHFDRPSWQRVEQWQEEMLEGAFWRLT